MQLLSFGLPGYMTGNGSIASVLPFLAFGSAWHFEELVFAHDGRDISSMEGWMTDGCLAIRYGEIES